jgi:intracellular multiplication protein IcmD
MKRASFKKVCCLTVGAIVSVVVGTLAEALSGIGSMSMQVVTNLTGVAQLITAGAYVAGMGFMVAAVVKFKAHKDNPTQVTIGQPIVLTFVAAALIFIPTIYKVAGTTIAGNSGVVAGVSGVTGFGAKKASPNS